ncbi:hypothetical protein B0H21DRAFT_86420 [Amylocystis lapponica]|nr:hypothetical protein B0H21DRAFT_86420 [Amylocystis lapponica]
MSEIYTVYTLHVLSAQVKDTVQRRPRKAPNLYVKIRHSESDITPRTPVVPRSYTPVWDSEFSFQVKDLSSLITLELKHDAHGFSFHSSIYGNFEATIQEYLELCKNGGGATVDLVSPKNPSPQGKLGWTLKIDLIKKSEQEAIDSIQQRLEAVQNLADTADQDHTKSPLKKALKGLAHNLEKLEGVVQALDELTQAGPYINVAWKVVSLVYKTYKSQQDRDHQILQLVERMDECIIYIVETKILQNKQTSFQEHLCKTMQQVLECSYFIQEYFKDGFTKRLLHQTWSNIAKSIDGMIDKLDKVHRLLDVDALIHTALVSSQILKKVDVIGELLLSVLVGY